MLSVDLYEITDLISVQDIKNETKNLVNKTAEILENLNDSLLQPYIEKLESTETNESTEANSTENYDPLGLKRQENAHKRVLKKLVITCFTVCFINVATYLKECGNDLCNKFY